MQIRQIRPWLALWGPSNYGLKLVSFSLGVPQPSKISTRRKKTKCSSQRDASDELKISSEMSLRTTLKRRNRRKTRLLSRNCQLAQVCTSRVSRPFEISTRNQVDIVEKPSTISEQFSNFESDHFRRRRRWLGTREIVMIKPQKTRKNADLGNFGRFHGNN